MSESASPESGALSVDQAIASLVAADAPAEQTEAPEAPLEAAEGEETEGEASAPEATEDGAETPAEEEEAADAEEPAKLDAPLYWKPEAKAVFNAMTPEQQAVVLAQEGPREEVTAKAKAQAAAEIEKAQKEVAGVQTLAQQLSEFLPQAVKTFQQRWGEPDWTAVAQQQGAENAFILKTQYETEQKQLAQLAQAEQAAQTQAQRAFVQTELKTLATLAPDLADATDPAKGAEKRQEIAKYLLADGFPAEAVNRISAKEMLIAHKAKLWDEAQAALKAPKPPKTPPQTAQRPASTRPSAAPAAPSSQRTATAAAQRFGKSLSQEDAIALLVAKG